MQDFIHIFETVGFPIATAAVLFYALYYVVKSQLKQGEAAMQIVKEANEQHIQYVNKQNEKLTGIISDCTKALSDNTKAFNELIILLQEFRRQKKPD